MSGPVTFARAGNNAFAALARAWSQLWFQSRPTSALELTRMGVGGAMLINYGLATPYLFLFWGDDGWMPRSILFDGANDPWVQSVFFYFSAPWQWAAFHVLFLLSCAALMLGWRTSWVKWIVLFGQMSYANRNPMLTYGVDQILACLLIILCVAPIGRGLSLDRVRAIRAAKHGNLEARLPRYSSPWAGACTQLMQFQMAVLFFFSGINKLRGDAWWSGDSIWAVVVNIDFYNRALLDVLAPHYWMVNVATYLTVLIEIAYPFLIWQRATRPYLLGAAIFLHLMFGTVMRMPYFSFVMVMGHVSFVREQWLTRLGEWWQGRIGEMEMIYDGRCGFCVRSMVWFLSFDGLGQIKVRNFRKQPSPVVSDAQMEKALYLVLPDGRALPGFEAYRYVVARVPGLWWQVPFFYVPLFSRMIGRPLYNWIAANRSRLSATRLGGRRRT